MKFTFVVFFLFFNFNLFSQEICNLSINRHVNSELFLYFNCDSIGFIKISIEDNMGNKVDEVHYLPKKEERSFLISFDNFDKGLYWVSILYKDQFIRCLYEKK